MLVPINSLSVSALCRVLSGINNLLLHTLDLNVFAQGLSPGYACWCWLTCPHSALPSPVWLKQLCPNQMV